MIRRRCSGLVLARGVLLTLLVLAGAPPARAQVSVLWQELGGSASDGLSDSPDGRDPIDPAVALGVDGRPVVVYTEQARPADPERNGSIIVKRWAGSAWQTLSGVNGIGHGRKPQVAVSSNGTLYVAWMQEGDDGLPTSTQVHLLHRTASGSWQQLGGSNTPGGLTAVFDRPGTFGVNAFVRSFSLALTLNGQPMVAFDSAAQTEQTGEGHPLPEGILYGSGQVYVKRYNPASNAWEYLGSDPFIGGGASSARSFFVQSGTGYVTHFASNPSLAVRSDGTPLVAFAYGTWYDGPGGTAFIPDGSEIFVTQFVNGAWTALGPAVPQLDDSPAAQGGIGGVSETPTTSGSPALATGPLNEVWVAWFEHSYGFPPFSVFARRWSGVTWDELASSGSGDGLSNPDFANGYPALAIGPDRIPVVAYSSQALDRGPRIFVKQGNGAFVELGADSAEQDGISGEDWARTPMIAAPPAGSAAGPAVVWVAGPDGAPRSKQVFLRQFAATSFRLDVAIRGNGSSIISTPSGIDCPGQACAEVFPAGALVTLEPVPGPGELFDRWSGACTGSGACTVRMSGPRSVNASFVGAATLSVARTGTGASFGTVNGLRVACGGDCEEKYRLGTSVTLTVSAPTGTLFGGWAGDCAFRGRNASCPLTMSADRSVSAEFTQRVYRLAVAATTPAGTTTRPSVGRVRSSRPAGAAIDCVVGALGTCAAEVPHGARVTLAAVSEPGNRFLSWSGGPCAGRTSATCDFTMAANISIGALFRSLASITVGKIGNGQGRIVGPGIDCGNDCVGEAFTDMYATVTFTPAPGTIFQRWEGAPCFPRTVPTCRIFTTDGGGTGDSATSAAVTLDFQFSARAELRRHTLRISVDGAGVVAGGGVDCGGLPGHADCAEEHDYGTSVTLAAIPATDTMLAAWTGCSRVNGSVCVVDMTASRAVRARFAGARTLDVMTLGNGRGRITAPTAPPLVCVAECSASRLVPVNTSVVLTPRPDAGSTFRWMDASDMCMPGSSCWMGNIMCSGSGPCAVPMSQNRTALGRFMLNRHRLVVTRPLVGGSVASFTDLPEGIDCGPAGSQCSSTADYGMPVGLQATAEADFIFTRWTGTAPCSAGARATEAACTFALQGNVTATPLFRRRTLVSLAKDGTGTGTVTATGALSPASVSCGPACGETDFQAFDGRDVTLRATASVGSTFTGFTGACGSNASVCKLAPVGSSQDVVAGFTIQTRTLNVNVRGSGSVTGAQQACDAAGSPCVITGLFGDTIELMAFAGPTNRLLTWTGCSSVSGLLCRVNLTGPSAAPVAVTAIFTVSLVVWPAGDGTGSVTGPGINCPPDCDHTYSPGTVVTLTRGVGSGSGFGGWGDDCAFRGTNATCTLTLTGDRMALADFIGPRALTIFKTGRDDGTVVSQSGEISCGSRCESFFPLGGVVTLVATPANGAVFAGFEGASAPDCESTPTPMSCRLRMTVSRTIDARFEPANRLTVTRTGPGAGTIVSDDGRLLCDVECTAPYPVGSQVVLWASPDQDSRFEGWSGPCSGQDTCTMTMVPGGVTVGARFEQAASVSIGFAGLGAGFVDLATDPAGSVIRCGPGVGLGCRVPFDLGTTVILTPTATSGGFGQWEGACAGTPRNESCRLVLAPYQHAPFVGVQFLVDPVVAHLEAGSDVLIFSEGVGGCDRPCEQVFDRGTVVTFVAEARPGRVFTGWSGDCAAFGNASCALTLTGDRTVSATVVVEAYALLVILNGDAINAGGSVAVLVSSPSRSEVCTGVCTVLVPPGEEVTLEATVSDSFSYFDGYAGSCVEQGNPCVLTMDQDHVVRADFFIDVCSYYGYCW